MSDKIINGIDLSKYFKNHFDSWGRLYCVEYKGSPLELQNAIKRLQEENEELNKRSKALDTRERLLMKLEEKEKEDENCNSNSINNYNGSNSNCHSVLE